MKSPVTRLDLAPGRGDAARMDPDYLAFRKLLERAQADPGLAAEIERLMR